MQWQAAEMNPWLADLKAGEVVAAPAEGVYGYCCDPLNEQALQRMIATKGRDANKGFIVLVPSVLELGQLCAPLDGTTLHSIYDIWGQEDGDPVTIILPAKQGVPELLTGGRNTLAVRCPFAPYMQEYLKAWGGPLVSTSLNQSGEPPVYDAANIPAETTALTLSEPLPGTVSKIYDPAADKWLR